MTPTVKPLAKCKKKNDVTCVEQLLSSINSTVRIQTKLTTLHTISTKYFSISSFVFLMIILLHMHQVRLPRMSFGSLIKNVFLGSTKVFIDPLFLIPLVMTHFVFFPLCNSYRIHHVAYRVFWEYTNTK